MKKKVLVGTTNPSKVHRFKGLLSEYDVELLTLRDLGIVEEPQELGSTPEENAIIKAKFYGRYFDSVICNDSGLYFDELGIRDPKQPGLRIRTPQGKRLDDEEMISYYSSLVHSLGGRVLAYYWDGIAIYSHGEIVSFIEDKEVTKQSAFYMVDKVSENRHPGWPLDSLSLNRNTLTYFVDKGNHKYDTEDENVIIGEYRKRLIHFLATNLELVKSGTSKI